MTFAVQSETDEGIHEINMTPLVDVMLVLLIIFIVTIPVVKQAIEIDLPDVAGLSVSQQTDTIEISVQANGDYFIDGKLTNIEELKQKFKDAGAKLNELNSESMTSLQIHGDEEAKYARIAQVMSLAQQNGINKIGFVMDGDAQLDDK
jgi:biopolymer transport protein ExbD